LNNGKTPQSPPVEDEDISNSHHIPSTICQFGSVESYQSMLSEITLPMDLATLLIDPRAPQYQMAMEHEQQDRGEVTIRANNHSLANQQPGAPPKRRVTPPKRRVTPLQLNSPPPPMQITPTEPIQKDTYTITEEDEGFPPSTEPIGRTGSAVGPSTAQPPSSQFIQGPFPGNLLLPSPAVHNDDDDVDDVDSTSRETIGLAGPFVSPSAVPRSFLPRPNTPGRDSNPLLFPMGLFPPSPAKQSLDFKVPKAAKSVARNAKNLPSLLVTQSVESSSTSSSTSQEDHFLQPTALTATETGSSLVRVKMCPMEITYIIDEQTHVHAGYYSGALNFRGAMHGNGAFWFITGDLYIGQFSDGQLHGFGAMSIQTSSCDKKKQIFKGVFRNNQFLGEEEVSIEE
jgi:hypothetical protein